MVFSALFGRHLENLHLKSTLGELQLYGLNFEWNGLGTELIEIFAQQPEMPGVILVEQSQYKGMLSRQRFLELLIRPQAKQLFLRKPLRLIYSYVQTEVLSFAGYTSILEAGDVLMQRSPSLQSEPIVVQFGTQTYKLVTSRELSLAYWQIKDLERQKQCEHLQAQIVQSEKMASLGRLVDGLAHEILDPVGFIWGNLSYISIYSNNLLELIAAYERCLADSSDDTNSVGQRIISQLKEDIELDYLQKDLPRAIQSMNIGAERLKKLVTSLQSFTHIDSVHPKPADIHECLNSILLLLKTRFSQEIQIAQNYGHLPPVPCFLGELNQVFMNIISDMVNVLIEHVSEQKSQSDLVPLTPLKPTIEITTKVISLEAQVASFHDSRWVSIRIRDNGPGIPAEELDNIVRSFSHHKISTKAHGLTTSYRIVTVRHKGKFEMRSQIGVGTEFEILLPLL